MSGRLKELACQSAATMADLLLRLTRRRAGVVLLYHAVGECRGDPDRQLLPTLERSEFRRQLRYLLRRYEVVPLDGLLDAVARRRRGQPFPVSLTFDDDEPDHLRSAMPILRRVGVPATFFIGGARLSGDCSGFWWQRLQRAVERGVPLSRLTALLPPESGVDLEGAPGDLHRIAEAIRRLPPDSRDELSARLLALAGPDPPAQLLSSDEIAALAGAGFTIGFHTRRHDSLPDLDDAQLQRALRDNREEVANVVGRSIDMIAYPHGAADSRVASAARGAGFRLGLTARRAAVTSRSDALLLGRFEPRSRGPGDFALGLGMTLLVPDGARRLGARLRSAGAQLFRRGRSGLVSHNTRSELLNRYGRMKARPRPGHVDLGALRRLRPFSRRFGFDRGQPIDRYYIEAFLREHAPAGDDAAGSIRGRVLEIGDSRYIRRFADGGAIDQIDVLDVSAANSEATLVGDLADGSNLPSERFDCVICTQTLLLIYDLRAAVRTLHRLLKPGGTLFVTLPGISQICRPEMEVWGDYWRFTTASALRLLEEAFEPGNVTVSAYGNVLTATAFLYGLATADLDERELDFHDPDYQLLIGVKATKQALQGGAAPTV